MKKMFLFTAAFCLIAFAASAQKFGTRAGKVAFYSTAGLEEIEAHNSSATSAIDAATGKIQMAVLVKGFMFEKALMQEHFNENYLESDKYPKASFDGMITNISAVKFKKDGTYPITIKGKLTMHGVTKDIETTGSIVVKGGKVSASALFNVKCEDYNIAIPAAVKDKIAKVTKIAVNCDYTAM